MTRTPNRPGRSSEPSIPMKRRGNHHEGHEDGPEVALRELRVPRGGNPGSRSPGMVQEPWRLPMKRAVFILSLCVLAGLAAHAALPVQTTFTGAKSERTWPLAELNAELP